MPPQGLGTEVGELTGIRALIHCLLGPYSFRFAPQASINPTVPLSTMAKECSKGVH
jgi:hypothetical protein